MKQNIYKYGSTDNAQKQLIKKFPEFKNSFLLIDEKQTEKIVGQPYIENACWLNNENQEIFFYEFESFVMPSGYLSSDNYELTHEKFVNVQDFYIWTQNDKEKLTLYNKIKAILISCQKDDMEKILIDERSVKFKVKI